MSVTDVGMTGRDDGQQNDLRMRAALSHSMSSVAGQYVSRPKRAEAAEVVLMDMRLVVVVVVVVAGGLILSAHPNTLSRAAGRRRATVVPMTGWLLRLARARSPHEGSRAETRCMVQTVVVVVLVVVVDGVGVGELGGWPGRAGVWVGWLVVMMMVQLISNSFVGFQNGRFWVIVLQVCW